MLENKHSEKLIKKHQKRSERLKKRNRTTLIWITAIIFAICGYVYLLHTPFTMYREVIVPDGKLQTAIKNSLLAELSHTSYSFFPNSSLISPTLTVIKKKSMIDVPELETLTLTRDFVTRYLFATYTLRTPVFKNINGYYLDTNNLWYQDKRMIPLPTLNSTKQITLTELKKLIFLKETIETALFPIETITVDELFDTTFILKTDSQTQIIFSLKQDEKEVWSKIVSVLETSPLKENKETFAKVQKLDVRFGNKVYYKMILSDGITLPKSTATTTYERN